MTSDESTYIDPDGEPTSLYRMWGDGERLLYIGITRRGHMRIWNHARDKEWWRQVIRVDVEHYPSRDDAALAEARAIYKERPIYNAQHAMKARKWEKEEPIAPPLPATRGGHELVGLRFKDRDGASGAITGEPYSGLLVLEYDKPARRVLMRSWDMSGWELSDG